MGFFSKKKEEPKQEHPEFLKLVEKWEAFLSKIEARFNESLINAEEALFENLVKSDYDLGPTMTAWQGIKSQLNGLGDKVDTTFDEKVLPQMLQYKEHYDLLDEGAKGTHLREDVIHTRVERFEVVLEGKIASLFYKHAIQHLNEDFNCTQCSAKIEVRKDIFQAHYVSCAYCNTVNTFTPKDKITAIRWVVDNIAKYEAIAQWDSMQEARDIFSDYRVPNDEKNNTEYIAIFKKREDTERVFWTSYFTKRSVYLSEYKETIKHDVDVKMKGFYQERKRELDF